MDSRNKSITFQSITIPSLGRSAYSSGPSSGKRTSMRCLRLFVFAFLLPCLLIAVPLYMRQVTLAPRVYTMTASDMRVVQDGISSVWCEAQELSSEAPFTSYRTDGPLPQHSRRLPVTLRHKLTLTDDVREFWGFYLLRGSRISVSACARWPGTSLLLVHGWKALNECVWVGQLDSVEEESSEEEDDDEEEADEEALDPVRRQWREFIRQNPPPAPEEQPTPVRSEQQTGVSPAGFTPAKPAQTSRVFPETQPAPADQAGGADWRTSQAQDRFADDTKTIYSETQLVQRAEEVERKDEKRWGDLDDDDLDELDTEPSIDRPVESRPVEPSPVESQHQDSTDARPTSKDLSAPLTNDVIERRVQSAVRRRRAAAAGGAAPAVAPPRDPTSLADRLTPLTYNGHRGRVNQTLARLETSGSEMMSSFSSSEEALLSCEGVIVNQPLRASASCTGDRAAADDHLTVQVIGDDYYYLVFSSENEVLPVDVFFDVMLDKTVYDVRAAEAVCAGSRVCTVPLGFWSSDTVYLGYPVDGNASEAVWSEQYTIRSSCQSRGWLVAIFIVAALLSLLVCAFC